MYNYEKKVFENVLSLGKVCYQCSTCTGGCPVFRHNPNFNPRIGIAKLILDSIESAFVSDAWNCCSCLTCSQRCPQGVDLAHLMVNLKNLSVRKGDSPIDILNEMKLLSQTGMAQKTSTTIQNRRKRLNLSETLYPNLMEIQKIMDVTGFTALLKLNVNKKRNNDSEERF
ncbi:MAG: 4Fe-4S dicluster domain-containing protein [Candidatus Hodarchaeota archaeon]